jgi:arginine/ornithine transport system permease protein
MRTDIFWLALPSYLTGAATTVLLLLTSLLLGFAAALPLAIMRASNNPWLSRPVWLYTYVIRGTPLLVQLFILYFGMAQFAAVRDSMLWPLLSSAWFCASLAFALNTTAYTTEIFAGALRAVGAGEREAAKSMGMSPFTLYRRILLPDALRRALPAYSNEAVFMLHATSLAGTVTLFDLTAAARAINADTYRPFESFGLAAVLYLLMTFALVGGFRLAERRWLGHLRAR